MTLLTNWTLSQGVYCNRYTVTYRHKEVVRKYQINLIEIIYVLKSFSIFCFSVKGKLILS